MTNISFTYGGLSPAKRGAAYNSIGTTSDPFVAQSQLDAVLGGSGVENSILIGWALAGMYRLTSSTYDSDNILFSAGVVWPDDSAGVLTVLSRDLTWFAVKSFEITHIASGKTVLQDPITRDANGNISSMPALQVLLPL